MSDKPLTQKEAKSFMRRFSVEHVNEEFKKLLPEKELVAAEYLSDVTFPKCCDKCAAGLYFGLLMCTTACPEKFEVGFDEGKRCPIQNT